MNGTVYNCKTQVSMTTIGKLALAAFVIGFMWNGGVILAEYILEGWIFK